MPNEAHNIESRILTVVEEVLAVDSGKLTIDSSIGEDLAADSMDQLTLFLALEDEFGGAPIAEEDVTGLATLADVADYIRKRLGPASAA